MQQEQTKSIFVAIVGRPNVGKSSLLNRMVGEKVAIVTAKPQTTRTRITGILTRGAVQYVFLDTPGIHRPRTRLGERMAKATADSVAEVDAVVMLFEPYGELTEAEQALVEDIRVKKVPALAGFMPDLVACADCVKYEGGAFCFDARKGRLYCGECAAKRELECNLDPAALAAMRHIVFSGDDKLFSFSLAEHSTQLLGAVTGRWALYCVDRPLRSLDFLNTVLD